MYKKQTSILFFITGIINAIISIVNFTNGKLAMGVTYVCLAVTFVALGASYRKKLK